MTPLAIATIRTDFAALASDEEGFAEEFYARLYVLAPSVRPLLRSDLRNQGLKLISTLGLIVRSLERLDAIGDDVRALGRRHVRYGVRSGDCAVVGEALLDTLQRRLPAFGEEARAAWAQAFVLIADMMMDGAQGEDIA